MVCSINNKAEKQDWTTYSSAIQATETKNQMVSSKFRVGQENVQGKEHREPEMNEVVPGPLEVENRLESLKFKVKTTAALISMTTVSSVQSDHPRVGKSNALLSPILLTVGLLDTRQIFTISRQVECCYHPILLIEEQRREVKQSLPDHCQNLLSPFSASIPSVTAHLLTSLGSTFHFQHALMVSIKHIGGTENFS